MTHKRQQIQLWCRMYIEYWMPNVGENPFKVTHRRVLRPKVPNLPHFVSCFCCALFSDFPVLFFQNEERLGLLIVCPLVNMMNVSLSTLFPVSFCKQKENQGKCSSVRPQYYRRELCPKWYDFPLLGSWFSWVFRKRRRISWLLVLHIYYVEVCVFFLFFLFNWFSSRERKKIKKNSSSIWPLLSKSVVS